MARKKCRNFTAEVTAKISRKKYRYHRDNKKPLIAGGILNAVSPFTARKCMIINGKNPHYTEHLLRHFSHRQGLATLQDRDVTTYTS